MKKQSNKLADIYKELYSHFGAQNWWPGDTRFEVMAGAILTQNAAWTNVEKAILNLKKAKVLTPEKLHRLNTKKLGVLIKPSGFFNVKAKRLKNFLNYMHSGYGGSIKKMMKKSLTALRHELLNVNGIGKETADSILLYALDKPIFVVDAYTKRLLIRRGIIDKGYGYYEIKELFESNLKKDLEVFQEFHALIVENEKREKH